MKMNQENKIVFRNALNGYNKADVNAYLADLAKEFERREEEWARETEKFQQALVTAAEEKEVLLEKYKKLTTENDVLEAEKRKAEVELAKIGGSAKENKQTTDELSAELSMEKAKLASANTILNSQHETAIKQKKHVEALAAELTTLKQKMAERNAEIDSLRKALAASEQVGMERYAEIAKQAGILEGYASQIQLMKTELDAKNKLLENFNKANASGGADRTVTEMRTEMDKFISAVDAKLETKLSELTVKAEPVKEEKAEEKPAEAPVKAEKQQPAKSDIDKKLDSFFGA